jgi:hypothetical protein
MKMLRIFSGISTKEKCSRYWLSGHIADLEEASMWLAEISMSSSLDH